MSTPVAPAVAPNGDPALAAAAVIHATFAAFENALKHQSMLERTIPANRQMSSIRQGEEAIVETDAPEWISCIRQVEVTSHAHLDALWNAVSTVPETPAGAVALLQVCISDKGFKSITIGIDEFYALAESLLTFLGAPPAVTE